ncbi:zinc finger protein 271-like [Ochlerotatus camptorhynchus]|uniref:zinc finger protein 271-like n=1 Tax=Ochlerotatus camptorhynchus TaxID=644619 RepID=UPI0031DBDEAA
MAILNLNHFPNVCRLCIQPKPDEQLIPIECSTLEHGTHTMLELLNNFTFEMPKDVSELVPKTVCAKCFAVFEFAVQYQLKLNLLMKFQVAFARLKTGNRTQMVDLFSDSKPALENMFRELTICEPEEVQLERFLEYDPGIAKDSDSETTTVVKLEEGQKITERQDDIEYYNVEYIEDGEAPGKQNEEFQEAIETIEFLEDTEDCSETFFITECEENSQSELQSSKQKSKTRMLQCPFCEYRTTSNEMFQHHRDRHENPNDENPWKCSFAKCSEAYATKEDLLKHKKEMHSKYVCDICGMVLKHKYTLELHLRRHKGDSKYPCQYCSTSYFTSNELKLHMSVIHLNVTDFLCNDCGLAFKNKKSLALHEKTHSEQRSFPCDECNMAFKTSAHLRRHHNNVHRAIKFTCTMCTVSYGRKDKLRMHMEKSHNIQTYFPCEICLKSFTTSVDLHEHKEHHDNPKDLECAVCLSAFFNQQEFDEHLCISYRDDYICCDRDFKYHLQYNKHMFLVHGRKTNARVRPASNQLLGAARASRKQVERCTKCEQVFPTRKLKKDHMAVCLRIENHLGVVELQQEQQTEFYEDDLMEIEDKSQLMESLPVQAPQDLTHVVVKMQ